jgi:hypothetical protein
MASFPKRRFCDCQSRLCQTFALFVVCCTAIFSGRAVFSDSTELPSQPRAPLVHPIHIICVYLPHRLPYMQRLLSDVQTRAPGEFAVSYVRAATSLSDPRVADWASNVTFTEQGLPYLPTLSHTLAMGIAANASLPSVIIEDDVILHKAFHAVVIALSRRTQLPDDCVVQFGYILRSGNMRQFEGMLLADSATFCVQARHAAAVDVSLAVSGKCSSIRADASAGTFVIGLSKETRPWGAQAYLVTPRHARNVWASRYSVTKDFTEDRLFGLPGERRALRVVPPLAVEDHPRFATSVGHPANVNRYYWLARMTANFKDYYCPALPPSEGPLAVPNASSSDCLVGASEDVTGPVAAAATLPVDKAAAAAAGAKAATDGAEGGAPEGEGGDAAAGNKRQNRRRKTEKGKKGAAGAGAEARVKQKQGQQEQPPPPLEVGAGGGLAEPASGELDEPARVGGGDQPQSGQEEWEGTGDSDLDGLA